MGAKAATISLRSMSANVADAKDVKETAHLTPGARETPETVTADNPSKEYVTGSGKPSAPLGAKGRNG